jgi:hypothetical protein
MVIQSPGGIVTGNLSFYNPTTERYSVLFEKEGEEMCELREIKLNKYVFQVYQDQEDLDESQDLRLKNIVTALGVWDSIALQIPEDEFTVNGRYVASWWNPGSWFKAAVSAVVQALPVIAFAAAIILCPPLVVIAVSITINRSDHCSRARCGNNNRCHCGWIRTKPGAS